MPPLPPDARPFLDAVADAPDDPHSRLVFADWLEERGRAGAGAACRWLAAGNRPDEDAPDAEPDSPFFWFAHDPAVRAEWDARGYSPHGMLPPGVTLPGEPSVADYRSGLRGLWWDFPSRAEAERALLEAWPDGTRAPP